jgi:Tfp pilus assembly protein PilZ
MTAGPALLSHESSAIDRDDLVEIAHANDVDERRPQLRLVSRWALRAALAVESEDGLYAHLSYDIAEGGVFVATYDAPPVGARVDLKLTLPDGSELDVVGVVRWIRDAGLASDGLPAGCGIECKGLPLDAQRAIADFARIREPLLWLPEAA